MFIDEMANARDTARSRGRRGAAASVGVHAAVIGLVALGLHARPPFVAPYRLPGSPHGTQFVVAYLPDRPPEQPAAADEAEAKQQPRQLDPKTAVHAAKAAAAAVATTHALPDPNAATGADALGSGNITLALLQYYPTPAPDLAPVPAGTRGDVIVRVVIGTDGKISELKLVSGIGYGVDETVMATVGQWVFHPALENGRPVASEQEVRFHYTKG